MWPWWHILKQSLLSNQVKTSNSCSTHTLTPTCMLTCKSKTCHSGTISILRCLISRLDRLLTLPAISIWSIVRIFVMTIWRLRKRLKCTVKRNRLKRSIVLQIFWIVKAFWIDKKLRHLKKVTFLLLVNLLKWPKLAKLIKFLLQTQINTRQMLYY
jgi:hypothetical protein